MAGNYLRVGFSRVEWQAEIGADGRSERKKNASGELLSEDNWTWPSTGKVAMHMPERWGYFQLSDRRVGEDAAADSFEYPAGRAVEKLLWAMFYEQEARREATGKYCGAVADFGLTAADRALLPDGAALEVQAIANKYEIMVTLPDGARVSIDESGCLRRQPPARAASAAIKVYGWYDWNAAATSADELKAKFAAWKRHGLYGVCVNCGFDFERVRMAAAAAHAAGLEYHAWAPAMIQDGCDASWYTVNRFGQSASKPEHRAYVSYYQTLDPHHPEVMKFLVGKYRELSAIPGVDYVQLDYIRYADVILAEGLWPKCDGELKHEWRGADGALREYPAADYCYCADCCADFLALTGIDIKAKIAAGVDPQGIVEWAQFRCDNVTRLVNAICRAVHETGGKISADVFPGPKSHAEPMVRQQWNRWDVDIFFPMNYHNFYLRDTDWIGAVTREETASVEKPVVCGLMICRDWLKRGESTDPERTGLSPKEIGAAIKAARASGASGVSLFTPDAMTDEHWRELEQAIGDRQ